MKKIGFSSGCFDWLSPGHVRLFKEARKHCDVLHILMADDATVRFYKGAARPLLTFSERVELITACRYIDEVHKLRKLPGGSNQFTLIKKIAPHIYFEGADATDQEIQVYLDTLNIKRITLDTPPLHVSDILQRYFIHFDTPEETLRSVAGL